MTSQWSKKSERRIGIGRLSERAAHQVMAVCSPSTGEGSQVTAYPSLIATHPRLLASYASLKRTRSSVWVFHYSPLIGSTPACKSKDACHADLWFRHAACSLLSQSLFYICPARAGLCRDQLIRPFLIPLVDGFHGQGRQRAHHGKMVGAGQTSTTGYYSSRAASCPPKWRSSPSVRSRSKTARPPQPPCD